MTKELKVYTRLINDNIKTKVASINISNAREAKKIWISPATLYRRYNLKDSWKLDEILRACKIFGISNMDIFLLEEIPNGKK